ncbi:hypothetical protein HK405_003665 [Cladochytrium tenue]|nr:hypothetical protein HK405_003665 [Cladochytrium tenue]
MLSEDPVYKYLDDAGITPSPSKMYQKQAIIDAITRKMGKVSLGIMCKGPYLSEIRVGLRGSGSDIAVPSSDLYLPSSCPRYGISYPPPHKHDTQEHERDFLVQQA